LDTSASNPSALAKILAAALALSVVGFLMTASLRTSSRAAAFQERIFENQIPSHIPLKIKIKKEKEESFKDLKNEKWLRGFELELTNTGDKPIYFVYLTMGTNVKVDNVLPAKASRRSGDSLPERGDSRYLPSSCYPSCSSVASIF
jgi:hypothetical protein